jgi:glycosyltransferase involved in cell wall biosynthesis
VPRVLFLAYHFPPVGGAGVQRSVKFVRYLPAQGWEPVVVTGPLGSIGDSYLVDPTLGEELPPGLEVLRVRASEPPPPGARRRRLERWTRAPSAWRRWWIAGAIEAARRAGPVDAVLATMSPFDSAAPAAAIAAERGVPWVADLRDPWALDEMLVYPSRVHRRLERRRMRRSLASAAAVVMNTPEAAQEAARAFPELARRVQAIPNGFDAADFAGPAPARDDRAFRIVHTGELHTRLGRAHRRTRLARRILGGAVDGVDVLARSHVHLLAAVARLRAREPELAGGVELHLAGNLSDADRAVSDGGVVREHGYLEHARSVALLRSADLLFLPMHGLVDGARARIVPGKTYEYLAARRPILAAVPGGDARDLLAEAGGAAVCDPDDVDGLADALASMLRRFRAGEPVLPPPREDVVARYERRALTARLAAVLDAVTAGNRPRIG